MSPILVVVELNGIFDARRERKDASVLRYWVDTPLIDDQRAIDGEANSVIAVRNQRMFSAF